MKFCRGSGNGLIDENPWIMLTNSWILQREKKPKKFIRYRLKKMYWKLYIVGCEVFHVYLHQHFCLRSPTGRFDIVIASNGQSVTTIRTPHMPVFRPKQHLTINLQVRTAQSWPKRRYLLTSFVFNFPFQ